MTYDRGARVRPVPGGAMRERSSVVNADRESRHSQAKPSYQIGIACTFCRIAHRHPEIIQCHTMTMAKTLTTYVHSCRSRPEQFGRMSIHLQGVAALERRLVTRVKVAALAVHVLEIEEGEPYVEFLLVFAVVNCRQTTVANRTRAFDVGQLQVERHVLRPDERA